jgi:hypothetical protein
MKNKTITLALAMLASLALCAPGLAADDHGHDHGPAATEAAASSRFEAHSDIFELVGVLDKPGQLTVYLDRYATNEPVPGAKIEFEAGSEKGLAAPQADGTYLVKIASLGKPGQVPFSFTVSAGSDTDLLAGELTVAEDHHEDEAHAAPWRRWAAIAAGALVLAALALFARRKIAARRQGAKA